LYKCYEDPIGPERTVRVCPVNDYKNHDYNPAMTEFKGDKVMYMDRRFETYMYKGSVHYTLTNRNFYPYSMLNKYEHQKDVNGNVTKEPTVTSLKEVNLHENTKNDQNAALVATAVVPVENKDNTQIMADSSWDKEELKYEEPATPLPVREETPKQTMSASHGVQAEDRLTPVNTVVAAGAIATVANTSDNKKDEIVESDKNEPKSDVQETSKTSNNKTNEPVYVAPVAAAAVVAPASTKTASPKPSHSGSASSVRSNKSIAGVPGSIALAGAVIASDMQPKSNPPPPQNNSLKDTKDEQKPPSENKEKVPSPVPVVPLVAAAVVGANASTTAPKQPTPAPKQEASQPSPAKSPSPSPPAAMAAPVAATAAAAAAASQSAGPEATKKPTPEVPVQEQKNPVMETSNPQNAAKPNSPSKTNLPPEVIATIEAYDAAHDGNEVQKSFSPIVIKLKSGPGTIN
ncbi:hypothetical protein FSP39_000650, partial [Pinctada imbricata]